MNSSIPVQRLDNLAQHVAVVAIRCGTAAGEAIHQAQPHYITTAGGGAQIDVHRLKNFVEDPAFEQTIAQRHRIQATMRKVRHRTGVGF